MNLVYIHLGMEENELLIFCEIIANFVICKSTN